MVGQYSRFSKKCVFFSPHIEGFRPFLKIGKKAIGECKGTIP